MITRYLEINCQYIILIIIDNQLNVDEDKIILHKKRTYKSSLY